MLNNLKDVLLSLCPYLLKFYFKVLAFNNYFIYIIKDKLSNKIYNKVLIFPIITVSVSSCYLAYTL